MEMADGTMPDINGSQAALDGSAMSMLDYRTPDMFSDAAQLSLDGLSALGVDALRIG